MRAHNYIWSFDEHGQPLDLATFTAALPRSVQGLRDDPYRSLAALVRKAGGYDKVCACWVGTGEGGRLVRIWQLPRGLARTMSR